MKTLRRESPRVDVEALCWEVVAGKEASTMAIDLSSMGLRIERPYVGGPTRREVQLEIEVPGIDEIMWAKGEACFDMVVDGPHGLLRRTGYRLAAAARRDLKMLREFVFETYASRMSYARA